MGRKIIGILGGMGPDATIDLYSKIIRKTRRRGAGRDQDHLEVVISSIPQTPDRTEALIASGPSPVAELVRSARRLEKAGADILAIACISAHCFLTEMEAEVSAPILNAVTLTIDWIAARHPDAACAGILATDATLSTRLYHDPLEKAGIKAVSPDADAQRDVMEAVFGPGGIKGSRPSPNAKSKVRRAAENLVERGADVIIAGCTEIPLAIDAVDLPAPLIDSTAVLAEAAVEAAMSD
jgi:aspartate racemase